MTTYRVKSLVKSIEKKVGDSMSGKDKLNVSGWAQAIKNMNKPESALGYTQYRFNCITDHTNAIQKNAVKMEMAWQNRDNYNESADIGNFLERQTKEINRLIESLQSYLEPLEDEEVAE